MIGLFTGRSPGRRLKSVMATLQLRETVMEPTPVDNEAQNRQISLNSVIDPLVVLVKPSPPPPLVSTDGRTDTFSTVAVKSPKPQRNVVNPITPSSPPSSFGEPLCRVLSPESDCQKSHRLDRREAFELEKRYQQVLTQLEKGGYTSSAGEYITISIVIWVTWSNRPRFTFALATTMGFG